MGTGQYGGDGDGEVHDKAYRGYGFRRAGSHSAASCRDHHRCGLLCDATAHDGRFRQAAPCRWHTNTSRPLREYREQLFGSNRIIVALEPNEGDVWTREFFKVYKDLTDDIFFLPGVSRHTVTSLWTPNTRYIEITEDGISADDVISEPRRPRTALTPQNLQKIQSNVIRGGFVGRLVADDFSSAMVVAELQDYDPSTGERLDYFDLAAKLEKQIRDKYENEDYTVRIIGFAKLVGDIADSAETVVYFFALAFALTALALYLYARSIVLTAATLFASLTSVVWQFGLLTFLGYGLDPLAVLVPFLIFAIGVSHGVQQINVVTAEIADGADAETAARSAFSRLFVPGSMALVTTLVSFATLYLIPVRDDPGAFHHGCPGCCAEDRDEPHHAAASGELS